MLESIPPQGLCHPWFSELACSTSCKSNQHSKWIQILIHLKYCEIQQTIIFLLQKMIATMQDCTKWAQTKHISTQEKINYMLIPIWYTSFKELWFFSCVCSIVHGRKLFRINAQYFLPQHRQKQVRNIQGTNSVQAELPISLQLSNWVKDKHKQATEQENTAFIWNTMHKQHN